MSAAKPILGYPSHSAAVAALRGARQLDGREWNGFPDG